MRCVCWGIMRSEDRDWLRICRVWALLSPGIRAQRRLWAPLVKLLGWPTGCRAWWVLAQQTEVITVFLFQCWWYLTLFFVQMSNHNDDSAGLPPSSVLLQGHHQGPPTSQSDGFTGRCCSHQFFSSLLFDQLIFRTFVEFCEWMFFVWLFRSFGRSLSLLSCLQLWCKAWRQWRRWEFVYWR